MFRHPRPVAAILALTGLLLARAAPADAGPVAPISPGIASGPASALAPEGTFAFEHVSVIPMDSERVLPDQTVVVRDGVIVAIGPAGEVIVPADAIRIDGRDRFLMPGLAEMHAHVPPVSATTWEWPSRETLADYMFLYVANGVTTIRGMLGAPYQLAFREELERGEVTGPTFYVGAPSINGTSAPTPERADSMIRIHEAMGYDLQKIHPGVPLPTWDRMVQAASEVGLTFGGHVPADVGLERALATGMSTVDHLDGYVVAAASTEVRGRLAAGDDIPLGDVVASVTPERIRELARATAEAGAWNIPTMYLWENLYGVPDAEAVLSQPEMRYVSPQQRESWRNQARNRPATTADEAEAHNELRRRILAALAEEGAGLLMGTDSPQMFNVPGFALHREIAVMAAAGLTNYQVLESGTRNVARYAAEELGRDGNFGTVAVGNRADLVLLDANPLNDLANLTLRAGVMVKGRWMSGDEIREGLARLARKHGSAMD
jgi:imidazolonepropionase-like amidohydrolase